LAGTHLAGLVFFLNPELPFDAATVARAILLYGGLLGGASLLALLPWLAGLGGRRAVRTLPWSLTCALCGAALLDWAHASYFAYLLPPGINARLIKTALWLSLGGVIAFYTALLHGLQRRRYGARSRMGLAAVCLLSVFAMLERREAYEAPLGPLPRPTAVEPRDQAGLLLVGVDAATLDAVLPLTSQGKLPFFATVLAEGAYGRLESITPTRSAALWTTVATGKLPYKHGVLGAEVHPAGFLSPGAELALLPKWIGFRRWGTLGGGARPPEPGARRASTLWEILSRLGVRTRVTAWPAAGDSLPAEPADASAELLYLPGLAGVSEQTWGGFHAVYFSGSRAAEDQRAAARLAAYYAELDRTLGEAWRLAGGPRRLLVIVSANGVRPASGVTGRATGQRDGLLLLSGPGIRRGAILSGARLVDVVPTLLYALGYPVARDFDGQVLTAAFTDDLLAARPLAFLPTYESAPRPVPTLRR
jgi:hypothetical protein